MDYTAFIRYEEVLCIKSIEGNNDIRISITFEDFDKIAEYVEKLKLLKTKQYKYIWGGIYGI